MIRFQKVDLFVNTDRGPRAILHDLTADITPGGIIGILGHRGQGKTTLINLLARRLTPTSGQIIHGGSVSWTLASIRPLLPTASMRSNIRFAAMIYRVDPQDLMRKVAWLGNMHDLLDVRINELPRTLQVQLAYCICLGLGFDYYLADEAMVIGDASFKDRIMHYMERTAASRTIILTTRSPAVLRRHCDRAYVLHGGQLHDAGSLGKAIRLFKDLGEERRSLSGPRASGENLA